MNSLNSGCTICRFCVHRQADFGGGWRALMVGPVPEAGVTTREVVAELIELAGPDLWRRLCRAHSVRAQRFIAARPCLPSVVSPTVGC
jgi:hypothetical protein